MSKMIDKSMHDYIKSVRQHGLDTLQFINNGCPVTDEYDTYPPDLYSAIVEPASMLLFLDWVTTSLAKKDARIKELEHQLEDDHPL